jgi:cell division cycle 20-like protein 1 (cofactor of APC complex)
MKTVLRSPQFSALVGRRPPQGSTRGQRQAASRAASGLIHRHGLRSEVHSPCLASRTTETDSCLPRIQGISGRRITSWTMVGHRHPTRTGSYRPSRMRSRVCVFACIFIIFATDSVPKEQANALFTSILHTEVTPPISPTRPIASGSGLLPSTPTRRRLFAYNSPSNPATPTRRLDDPTDEAYSMSPVRAQSRQLLESPRRQLRSVCKTPYRVLDAPELADDFYLNLVDWSSTNVLGVGLGSCVYLWTAHNAAVSKLCDLAPSSDTISSVSWVQKGSTLAVGTLAGRLHIYDANTLQLQRTYQQAHTQRIGALAWNTHVLSSGSRDRSVHHRDVREASTRPFKRCTGHRQEVCGLKWSGDSGASAPYLASGGNDNKVCIWDLRGSRRPGAGASNPVIGAGSGDDGPGDTPLWKFHEHTAAVKALAWDPHVSGVLATGGGTQDKHIRFWNVLNGSMLHELDTGSQVRSFVIIILCRFLTGFR